MERAGRKRERKREKERTDPDIGSGRREKLAFLEMRALVLYNGGERASGASDVLIWLQPPKQPLPAMLRGESEILWRREISRRRGYRAHGNVSECSCAKTRAQDLTVTP